MADEPIKGELIVTALEQACHALKTQSDYLTSLDQAMGDGDTGITLTKVADGVLAYLQANPISDIGKFLGAAGMAANKAAPSTMGTLLATALMRAGKEVMGKTEISSQDLVAMFKAADLGMQERGKAKSGDKTIIDALHPAYEAFAAALEQGASLSEAGAKALAAAEAGRDSVTPLRSKVGRASWVGERTEGQVDPGCEALVVMLKAVIS
ncbi:MAG: dihydroxyacetone kinase subunit L [Anaerolineales bacterium]|nr:dihydroxyacetone kinase subunit L [Anaerolineales bacterium]